MNKVHLNDFIDIVDDIEKEEKIVLSVGELVSFYTRQAVLYSVDSFNPSTEDYSRAYLDTLRAYLVEKIYKNVELK